MTITRCIMTLNSRRWHEIKKNLKINVSLCQIQINSAPIYFSGYLYSSAQFEILTIRRIRNIITISKLLRKARAEDDLNSVWVKGDWNSQGFFFES